MTDQPTNPPSKPAYTGCYDALDRQPCDPSSAREFPSEQIIEIDDEGRVHDVPTGAAGEDEENAWPLRDVLKTLAEFAYTRLTLGSYDGHGHEALKICVDRAREILNATPAASPAEDSPALRAAKRIFGGLIPRLHCAETCPEHTGRYTAIIAEEHAPLVAENERLKLENVEIKRLEQMGADLLAEGLRERERLEGKLAKAQADYDKLLRQANGELHRGGGMCIKCLLRENADQRKMIADLNVRIAAILSEEPQF